MCFYTVVHCSSQVRDLCGLSLQTDLHKTACCYPVLHLEASQHHDALVSFRHTAATVCAEQLSSSSSLVRSYANRVQGSRCAGCQLMMSAHVSGANCLLAEWLQVLGVEGYLSQAEACHSWVSGKHSTACWCGAHQCHTSDIDRPVVFLETLLVYWDCLCCCC